MDYTDLHLFLSKSNTIDDLYSCGLVGLRVPLIFGFQDFMILWAKKQSVNTGVQSYIA